MAKLRTKEELDLELENLGFSITYQSYEKYGNDGSFAYIGFASPEKRKEAERALKEREYPVSDSYWPSSARAEIRIRKFAGIKDW